ncbi:methylamine utilization protein [Marinomonas ostreistagni]|uniref:Methylamine utilization protein n=1 Tax=Marinomonas ostreistagni TaxID=359209 RepID=A0ABS0Z8C1_9GAMM|nr:methylamine utilization protein [Marinomonas ostreistagni]MBJ7549905.1 methylamine utilization protein [Marinomonas ostreistagni]
MALNLKRDICFALCLMPTLAWSDVSIKIVDASGQPLSTAVVFLKSPDIISSSRPLTGVEIAQKDRQFIPGVQVVTVGTAIEFPNLDDVRHHVYSFSPAKIFELKLYAQKPEAPVTFEETGIIELGCNIHDSMLGWVLVNDSSIYATTNDQGLVTFPGYKAGDYSIDVWHKNFPYGAPFESFKVQVTDNDSAHTLQLETQGVSF